MQIKIFTGPDPSRIENEVNGFIKGREVIDIKQSEALTTVITERNGEKRTDTIWGLTITVMYKEEKESVYENKGISKV
jgi:hypothetical protein